MPSSFAVVEIAGFQQKVAPKQKLRVPRLETEQGSRVTFDRVLLVSKGSDVTLGTPLVAGATVSATVLTHGKGEKIRTVKHKRRKRYLRTKGHRQPYTEIEISGISY
jgi:large subunit ribosomal protein L21